MFSRGSASTHSFEHKLKVQSNFEVLLNQEAKNKRFLLIADILFECFFCFHGSFYLQFG